MRFILKSFWAVLTLAATSVAGAPLPDLVPAKQQFIQEIARHADLGPEAPSQKLQLLDLTPNGALRVLADGRWHRRTEPRWIPEPNAPVARPEETWIPLHDGLAAAKLPVPWTTTLRLARQDLRWVVATRHQLFLGEADRWTPLPWPDDRLIHDAAFNAVGVVHIASSAGVFRYADGSWTRLEIWDDQGRQWAARHARALGFDSDDRLWVGSPAGLAWQSPAGWRFFDGSSGLPWQGFSCATAGTRGTMEFGTDRGLVRWDGRTFHYRQGKRWLPHDTIGQARVDAAGTVWCLTAAGLGCLEHRPLTLAEKARHYEREIEQYVKRTEWGYVAEARLRIPGDRASAQPDDSDNDGLWTAMYGAGECFAYAATRSPEALRRAQQAFRALRFLQTVTQGTPHSPPRGYVARTVRSTELPDPNQGRLAADRETLARHDRLWKVYEPRWPKSADGKWYWKSDTSSDELDGHFFFYGLYHEFCAEAAGDVALVREVVRDLADHFLQNDFVLQEFDGTPTRWGIFRPSVLNSDTNWWSERGLNSLSLLSYLTVAHAVTGEPRFESAVRDLCQKHHYDQNLMFPKAQRGVGSGNQSDDEMAFMCFYSLLRYSNDASLKARARTAFHLYWTLEEPEMNPFFNFAYAAHNLRAVGRNPFSEFSMAPWESWQSDAMATLYGFPLDRLNWACANSHRLDLRTLAPQASIDLQDPSDRPRGVRPTGKVLPVENRHCNHWNTDPFQLDYHGEGGELAAGTVFLLPYYLGLFHGFIAPPVRP